MRCVTLPRARRAAVPNAPRRVPRRDLPDSTARGRSRVRLLLLLRCWAAPAACCGSGRGGMRALSYALTRSMQAAPAVAGSAPCLLSATSLSGLRCIDCRALQLRAGCVPLGMVPKCHAGGTGACEPAVGPTSAPHGAGAGRSPVPNTLAMPSPCRRGARTQRPARGRARLQRGALCGRKLARPAVSGAAADGPRTCASLHWQRGPSLRWHSCSLSRSSGGLRLWRHALTRSHAELLACERQRATCARPGLGPCRAPAGRAAAAGA